MTAGIACLFLWVLMAVVYYSFGMWTMHSFVFVAVFKAGELVAEAHQTEREWKRREQNYEHC